MWAKKAIRPTCVHGFALSFFTKRALRTFHVCLRSLFILPFFFVSQCIIYRSGRTKKEEADDWTSIFKVIRNMGRVYIFCFQFSFWKITTYRSLAKVRLYILYIYGRYIDGGQFFFCCFFFVFRFQKHRVCSVLYIIYKRHTRMLIAYYIMISIQNKKLTWKSMMIYRLFGFNISDSPVT